MRVPGSQFFDYSEFAQHAGGQLPASSRPAVRDLVERWLDPLRRQFGRCVVNSGERSVAHNRAVGGAPQSLHVYSRRRSVAAADVSFARGTPQEWAEAAARLDPRCGLGVYPSHVHIDNRGSVARW